MRIEIPRVPNPLQLYQRERKRWAKKQRATITPDIVAAFTAAMEKPRSIQIGNTKAAPKPFRGPTCGECGTALRHGSTARRCLACHKANLVKSRKPRTVRPRVDACVNCGAKFPPGTYALVKWCRPCRAARKHVAVRGPNHPQRSDAA